MGPAFFRSVSMAELTICMPSHRPLDGSRAAIDSALAFCEARDALLVVSDNSGDAAKKAYLQALSPRLTYVASEAQTAFANMFNAVEAASTPFIMPMGDDDEILAEADQAPFDLDDLPFDYVGVLPVTESFLQRSETGSVQAFALEEYDPGERMLAYLQNSPTNNGGFYSILRREVWLATMDLFLRSHPTQAATCDWAVALSLFSTGKMAHDPSIRYRYNAAKWADKAQIDAERKVMLLEAGLPESAVHYEMLLLFLDVFVLINRVGSPLSIDERQRLGKFTVNRFLGSFIKEVADSPELYAEGVTGLAEMALEETDSFTQFQIAMLMAERLQPGLKDKYVAFIQASIAGA
ncbi:glycosyltransferase [Agrobacterium vitis]|nr:glycosyltransferase [Agrobacterium vitis]